MTRGRSVPAHERVYIDGYDMSGYLFDAGERGVDFDEHESRCFSDAAVGVTMGKGRTVFGPFSGVLDNTPDSGVHVLASAAQGQERHIIHLRGVEAEPAIGDDAFCAVMLQQSYKATGQGLVTVSMTFAPPTDRSSLYAQPFGALLHPLTSATAVNSANTNHDNGAATAAGGWFMYQIRSITGSGTVTISVDDSATGTTWAALAGATTTAIATASAPTCGVVELATNVAVRRYLRWQIAFGGSATACVFALAFMRG
jgi:hypothetical protein